MLWSLAVLPALAALLVCTLPKRRGALAALTCGTLALTLMLALWAAAGGWTGTLSWNAALQLQAGLTRLSAVVAVLVPAVALPVLGYAAAHEDSRGLGRLIALLLAFVGAMELLVVAADLLTLLIGWELVGACSWALIGHRWRDADNPRAGQYAFVMTRCGDLGLFLAAMAAFAGTGTFTYAGLAQLDGALLHLLVFGVLLSAAAKSGQLPFAPWLFRAMAGPTSVSALLHAATMVAAGAYLLIRLQPVLDRVAWFAPAAAGLGLATALAGGLVALLQPHAKKLLAASTSAHYGFMFVAVGAGYPAVALLHLVTHAAFKALMFLAAGLYGERAGDFDLTHRRLGRALPYAAASSAIGTLALAGVPPLGGAWTKEAVVTAAGHMSPWLAGAVILAGGLSAAYAARFQYAAFGPGGEQKIDARLAHKPETIALAALALASLILGMLWLPGARGVLEPWLGGALPAFKRWETIASLLAIAAGLYAGVVVARRYADLGAAGVLAGCADWLGLPALIERIAIRPIQALALHVAWLDDHVIDAAVQRVAALGLALARAGQHFVETLADGLPEGSARWVALGGEDTRRLQTGLSHHYYAMIAVGAALLAVYLILGS